VQHHMDEPDNGDTPDFQRMIILVTEAKAAARTLYELFPNRAAIEPLYLYLDDSLREVLGELAKATGLA